MTNLLYSAKHYQIKTAKDADRAKDEADRAKSYAESLHPETFVKTTGDQTIDGVKTFNNQVEFKSGGAVWNTADGAQRDSRYCCKFYQYGLSDNVLPPATVFGGIHCFDKNNFEYGTIYSEMSSNGTVASRLWVRTPKGTAATIGIFQDINGVTTTQAPTPAVSDNSTKIATTNYVNQKIQLVSALPSSPNANVFYCIPG